MKFWVDLVRVWGHLGSLLGSILGSILGPFYFQKPWFSLGFFTISGNPHVPPQRKTCMSKNGKRAKGRE